MTAPTTARQEQIDAKLRERNTAALEKIAEHLEKIDGRLAFIADAADPEWIGYLIRLTRAVEHSQGADLDPPWGEYP